jgi:hypothetical protein
MSLLDSVGHMMMDNDELHISPSAELADATQRWLVTLSAPLSAFNGDWIDDIATGKDDETIREGVAQMWDVRDRAGFEETARWLTQEGHRTAYEPVWRAMLSIDEIRRGTPGVMRAVLSMTFPAYYQLKASRQMNYEALVRASGKTAEEVTQALTESGDLLDDLRDDLKVPPETITSLIAWDAVRLASLSRWAVQLGYIGSDEFAHYAGGLAPQVREAYTGWAQLSAAYVVAGFIWNPSESRRENLTRTNRMLLRESKSPYRSVPWG